MHSPEDGAYQRKTRLRRWAGDLTGIRPGAFCLARTSGNSYLLTRKNTRQGETLEGGGVENKERRLFPPPRPPHCLLRSLIRRKTPPPATWR
jgi:hypothetical protein